MAAKDDSDKMRSLREIVRSKFTVDVLKSAGGTVSLFFLFANLFDLLFVAIFIRE
jgi:hypothetical protein